MTSPFRLHSLHRHQYKWERDARHHLFALRPGKPELDFPIRSGCACAMAFGRSEGNSSHLLPRGLHPGLLYAAPAGALRGVKLALFLAFNA